MNYLTQIESESDDVLDMLSHKNTKFIFLPIQSIFSTNRTTSKIKRHTVIADDNYAPIVKQCWDKAFKQQKIGKYF